MSQNVLFLMRKIVFHGEIIALPDHDHHHQDKASRSDHMKEGTTDTLLQCNASCTVSGHFPLLFL